MSCLSFVLVLFSVALVSAGSPVIRGAVGGGDDFGFGRPVGGLGPTIVGYINAVFIWLSSAAPAIQFLLVAGAVLLPFTGKYFWGRWAQKKKEKEKKEKEKLLRELSWSVNDPDRELARLQGKTDTYGVEKRIRLYRERAEWLKQIREMNPLEPPSISTSTASAILPSLFSLSFALPPPPPSDLPQKAASSPAAVLPRFLRRKRRNLRTEDVLRPAAA